MPKWIPCGAGFIEADVIRWKEAVWKKARRKGSRDVIIGERVVTAEVIRDKEGWVHLLIRAYAISNEKPGRRILEVLAKGAEIRRKRETIERGKPERLLWSDESARAVVTSKFF